MDYKARTQSLLSITVLLLISGFILRLSFRHQLSLYISPRYSWFAASMSLLAALLLASQLKTTLKLKAPAKAKLHVSKIRLLLILPISLMLTTVLLAPQKSLSSAAALQRGLNQASSLPPSNLSAASSSLSNYATDFNSLSLFDWDTIINSGQAVSYVGKQASVSGFVVPDGPGSFYVTRFFITCCALDATPIDLKVTLNSDQTYVSGQWVEVKGIFMSSGKSSYGISASHVQLIAEPEDPYAS